MRRCDVLVVGGGPSGATCAWALGGAGVDVVIIDRARFPRPKVCAGWVTPGVFDAIGLAPSEYESAGCRLQPFTAFETSVIGRRAVVTSFAGPVSYGITRSEFDTYLLRRVRTPVFEGTPLVTLSWRSGAWIANDWISAPIVVGAAGHFCPVARHARSAPHQSVVLAKQIELQLAPHEPCSVSSTTPELYFSPDLEGYGWCVRKGDLLNVGIGRRRSAAFGSHVTAFAAFLAGHGKVPARVLDTTRWHGHAYALAAGQDAVLADGLIVIGDAAGLAAPRSGEGIGPAVESGLAAARAIVAANGRHGVSDLQPYADWVRAHAPRSGLTASLRSWMPAAAGRALMTSPAFARYVVERWFLRWPAAREEVALDA